MYFISVNILDHGCLITRVPTLLFRYQEQEFLESKIVPRSQTMVDFPHGPTIPGLWASSRNPVFLVSTTYVKDVTPKREATELIFWSLSGM